MCEQKQINKIIEIDNIIYSLDLTENVAIVIGNSISSINLKIPRSIIYEMNEYMITKISKNAFKGTKINSIQFSVDSKLKSIENHAFCDSSIESISIPSSLIDLEEGWCAGMTKLTKIKVDPNNPRYLIYDNKYLIGKTSNDQENHDIFIFCPVDIETTIIPNFIKHIESYAFSECKQLRTVEFSLGSELQTIGNYA